MDLQRVLGTQTRNCAAGNGPFLATERNIFGRANTRTSLGGAWSIGPGTGAKSTWLKKAILHRKNSLFYKTANGARTGDLFMSLIHSCELCDANPFDYLTQLQQHAADLENKPSAWMPGITAKRFDAGMMSASIPARSAMIPRRAPFAAHVN